MSEGVLPSPDTASRDRLTKKMGFGLGISLFIIGVVLFFYFGFKGFYDVGKFLIVMGVLAIMVLLVGVGVYLYQKRRVVFREDSRLLTEAELRARVSELTYTSYAEKLIVEEQGMKQIGSNPLWFVKGHGVADSDKYVVLIDMQNSEKYQVLKNPENQKTVNDALVMMSQDVPLVDVEESFEENPLIGSRKRVERRTYRRKKNKEEPLESD